MKKLILILVVLFITPLYFAQSNMGTIKGLVSEKESSEPIPFANVSLLKDSIQILTTTTDFDGLFTLKPIPTGMYDLQVTYVGFSPKRVTQIKVDSLKLKVVNVELQQGVKIEEVMVYAKPIIEVDQTHVSTTVNRTQITQMAVRSVADITKSAKNRRFSKDNGAAGISVRGQRSGSSVTFIDGVKIIGSSVYEMQEDRNMHTNELYQEIKDNEFLSPLKSPLSTFSIDVDKASYANTRRYLNNGSLPPVDAVRIEEMINYFKYDYPQPEGEHPFSITTEMSDCPWNADRKLALIGIQGQEIDLSDAPNSNLVFLIDVSGSMNSYNKLSLLKKGLVLLIDELRSNDMLSIVVYAGAAGVVLEPTSGDKKKEIKRVLNQLQAGGSTAGGAGIQLAYKIAEENFVEGGNNRIILATDGDFNVGTSGQKELVDLIAEKRKSGVFLSVLGLGTGNLQDYKMEQLADKGNGNYNYIDNLLEAKKVLVSEMGGTLYTIAKDVKVQAEFNPNLVKAYRLIGYVNRALADEDFNDDRKDAGELGSGHTVTALYEIVLHSSIEKIMDVDSLKYQQQAILPAKQYQDELLTVKFRYKKPEGEKSILLTKVLRNDFLPLLQSSTNIQFSAAVASFGMKLRKTESADNMSYSDVIQLAKKAKGKDDEGYRAEFIKLVEMAQLIETVE